MNADIVNRIRGADWGELYPVLILFAQIRLRHALNTYGNPVIEGLDANVLLDQAIDKTMDGTRTWNYEEVSLEAHLKGVIRSDVSSFFKKDVARRIADPVETKDGLVNAIDVHMDHSLRPDSTVSDREDLTLKRQHLDAFKASVADDAELAQILESYEAGFTKPRDIAELTNMDPRRVDELKRKLLQKYLRFTDKHADILEKADMIRGRR